MTIRPLLLVLAIALLCFNCSGNQDPQETTSELEVDNQPTTEASLKELYEDYSDLYQDDRFSTKKIIERGKVYLLDEAPKDSVFFVFRSQLLEAVEAKNIFHLLEHIDEKVDMGEDGNGIDAFTAQWKLTDETAMLESPLWDKLKELLKLGGSFKDRGNVFVAPYYAEMKGIDTVGVPGVIFGQGVRIRNSPTLINTRMIDKLSYEIVQVIEDTGLEEEISGQVHNWYKIGTRTGKIGFVWGKFLKMVENTVTFKKVGDNWKIVKFISSS